MVQSCVRLCARSLQGDLDFQKDDEILITSKSNPDWWVGTRLADGKSGSLPAVFVVPKSARPAAAAAPAEVRRQF